MMSSLRRSNVYPEPSDMMGFKADIKKSSKQQQNSNMMKEAVLPTQATQSLKHRDMLKAKTSNSKQYGPVPREVKQKSNNRTFVQQKPSGNDQQLAFMVRSSRDDELVKHMSNLPGYLQRVERTENLQDKALNVGVLDWGRLENWKCNQKGIAMGVGNTASMSSSNLSTKMTRLPAFYGPVHNEIPTSGNKLRPPPRRNNSSHNNGVSRKARSSLQETVPVQDVDNDPRRHFEGQRTILKNCKSFDRSSSQTISETGKQRELDHNISSNVESRSFNSNHKRVPPGLGGSASSCDREAKQRTEEMRGSDINGKALKQKGTPGVGASSSKVRGYHISLSSKEKKVVDDRMKTRVDLQEPSVDLPQQRQAGESKNIVLLLPVKISESSGLMQRRSIDENVTGPTQNIFSKDFSDKEVFSSELHSEIPHSCLLLSRAKISTEQQEMAPDSINIQYTELPSSAISSAKSSNEKFVDTSRSLDQEALELPATKGRHPSPNRRFSFSGLGRMTRSFSFKESTAVPQLSSSYVSVKSGPVTSKASAGLDNSNRERESGHSRARSSPLRRILDPLLKAKGPTLPNYSRTIQSSRGSLNSDRDNRIATESLNYEKCESFRMQAHLILTRSSGFPLFRFVINDKNIIVAAPMKNLTSPWKSDQGRNYVFYSIDEIKRKSGRWINQVGKKKNCGFVYNVIGQMKVNDSSILNLSKRNSNAKESVLFGVERRQTGQASAEMIPNIELAAVVVKKPSADLGCNMSGNNKEKNFMETGFMMSDAGHSNSCTVILPAGIHSLPSTGVPSSLIHRWSSGGSCDCGGWDVGCKLHIFSNETQRQKLQTGYDACLMSDHLQLYDQGLPQQDRPTFSMATIEKGKYLVEYSPSISSLQAFFICVSVISCQKISDVDRMNNVYEEKVPQGYGNAKADGGMKKARTIVMADAPVKYTPSPPVSPVGRV